MLKKLTILAALMLFFVVASLVPIKISIRDASSSLDKSFFACKDIGSREAKECLTNVMLKEVRNNPSNIKNMFKFLSDKYGPDFNGSQYFHDIVHEVGEFMFVTYKDPYKAYSYCSSEFEGGCYHGVVMEYVNETQPSSASFSFAKAIKFCDGLPSKKTDYSVCIHGIGHIGIIKVKGDLNKALAGCDLASLSARSTCHNGVFMEYSRGDTQTGLHIHDNPLGYIDVPCESLSTAYKPDCYYFISRVNMRSTSRNSYYEAWKLCDSIEKEYRFFCGLGLGEKILRTRNYNIEISAEFCSKMEQYSGVCKDTIIYAQVYHVEQPRATRDICGNLPSKMKPSCLQGEIAYYNFILP